MKLVIVESPSKAKTINKYLGKDFKVIASYGHVRDLPSKPGSVQPENDFFLDYQITEGYSKYLKPIYDSAKESEAIYLATDPDREGEAISWHVIEILKSKKIIKKNTVIKRVAFNEITKRAVLNAIENPRDIDENLVNAQQARRALDYLVGFTLSPLLWRKLPGCRSAGRVQSVALRLISEREGEIEIFKIAEYWDLVAELATQEKSKFTAKLLVIEGNKLSKLDIKNEEQALKIKKDLEKKEFIVASTEKKQQSRNPQAPFTTSSLQQEAARKLGFSAKKTMQIAQKLYEGFEIDGETVGLITYMRTDGVSLSEDAVMSIREAILKQFGKDYLPGKARIYKAKAKNAQEAHEAIRPTDIKLTPEYLNKFLEKDFLKLYELIWKRTLSCQMENAIIDIVIANIETTDKKYLLRATGSTIKFDGFYRLYREGTDDSGEDEEDKLLPSMKEGDLLSLKKILAQQHFTEPPPRYTEASLVKKLEELGIGRPSTYASIISVIQDRNYVRLEKKRFFPEERGRVLTAFLTEFFPRYVQYEFTANLEQELDDIAEGAINWKDLLKKFWGDFSSNVGQVGELKIQQIIESLNESLSYHLFPDSADGSDARKCPSCTGGILGLRISKFGAFIACSGYPECNYKRSIINNEDGKEEMTLDAPSTENKNILIGSDTKSGKEIYLKKGPYGWYLQLGEAVGKEKPKRATIPPNVDLKAISLDFAMTLLDLPKLVGKHTDTGEEILMNIGKFGPYLKYNNKFYSIPKNEDPFKVDLSNAMKIITEYKSKS